VHKILGILVFYTVQTGSYPNIGPLKVMQPNNRWNRQFVLPHWYQLPIYAA